LLRTPNFETAPAPPASRPAWLETLEGRRIPAVLSGPTLDLPLAALGARVAIATDSLGDIYVVGARQGRWAGGAQA
jgi:hypothetical protein